MCLDVNNSKLDNYFSFSILIYLYKELFFKYWMLSRFKKSIDNINSYFPLRIAVYYLSAFESSQL